MKLTRTNDGYVIKLSARDTYNWAHKPGAAWPCSELADRAICVEVDSNGLCDIPIGDSGFIDGNELEAIIADHLPADLRHLWPTWAAPVSV